MEKILSNCCKQYLDLRNAKLSEEYYYNSLPLCIIDAVFSIGIRYSTTRQVVINFCNSQKIARLRPHGSSYSLESKQISIKEFIYLYKIYNIEEITNSFFKNRCRTSSRNGILKAEAVFRFAEVLYKYEINYFQDLPEFIGNLELENSIKQIPGQKSGISTTYFYMLAGDENYVKPDRMIIRFIESCIGKNINLYDATKLIEKTHQILKEDFPNLTLRELDHEIWKYQKNIT